MGLSFSSGSTDVPPNGTVQVNHKRHWWVVLIAIVVVTSVVGGFFYVSRAMLHSKDFRPILSSEDAADAFSVHSPSKYNDDTQFSSTAGYVQAYADKSLVGDGNDDIAASIGATGDKRRDAASKHDTVAVNAQMDQRLAVPIVVSYTRTSGASQTLDDLWDNHVEDFAGQVDSVAVLYDMGDGDYLVGNVAPSERDIDIVQTMVGPLSMEGQTFDDYKFDKDTGLLYLPKRKALEYKDEGLRMQMLAHVDAKNVTQPVSDIDVRIDNGGRDGVAASGRVSMSALGTVNIEMAKPDTLDVDDFKEVRVNGYSMGGPTDQMWGWDKSNGVLSLGQPAALTRDVEIVLTDNSVGAKASALIGAGLDKLFGVEKAHATDVNGYKRRDGKYNSVDKNGKYHPGHLFVNGVEAVWNFHGHPRVDQIVDFESNLWYADRDVEGDLNGVWKNQGPSGKGPGNGDIGGALPLFPRNMATYGKGKDNVAIGNSMIVDAATLNKVYDYVMNNGAKPSTANLKHQYIGDFLDGRPNPAGQTNPYYGLNFAVNHIGASQSLGDKGSTPGITVPDFVVTLSCGHMNRPNTGFDPGGNFGSGGDRYRRVRAKVLQVNKSKYEAIVAMATPASNSQAGTGMFVIKYAPPEAQVNMRKVSHDEEWMRANPGHYTLDGATYQLRKQNANSDVVATVTTKGDGTTDYVKVAPGKYKWCEVSPSKGHNVRDLCKGFSVSADQKLTIVLDGKYDEPMKTAKIAIRKHSVDNDWVKANGAHYSLAGAKYSLKSKWDNKTRGTFTTGEDGTSNKIENLKAGDYQICESTASKGHNRNTKCRDVTLNVDQDITLDMDGAYAEPMKLGKLAIQKVSADPDALKANPSYYSLANAKYELKHNGAVVFTFVTGSTGKSKTPATNLKAGDYEICEIQASKGHGLNGKCKPVTLGAGESKTVTLDGEYAEPLLKAKLGLKKVSVDPNWVKANPAHYSLEGAQYVLKQGENVVHTFTTKIDGTTDKADINAGKYTLCETRSSKGHSINTQCRDITINVGDDKVVTMNGTYAEPLAKGKIAIKKVSADPEAIKGNPLYSLAGAQYELRHNGKAVHTFTTKADGVSDDKAEVNAGDYEICETKASLGHSINSKCKRVTVHVGDDVTVTLDGEYAEPMLKAKLGLQKVSADPNWVKANPTYYSLEGAKYALKQGETIVHTFVTKADGTTDKADINAGRYTLCETRSSKGHSINTQCRDITVNVGDDKVVTMDGQYAEPLAKGRIGIKKVSADPNMIRNNPLYSLAGAQYVLKHNDTVVHTFTTKTDGASNNKAEVNVGDYQICETKASLGHSINSKCRNVTVHAGDDVTVTLDGKYAEPVMPSTASLRKVSANPQWLTANAKYYSLEGAVYELRQGDRVVKTLTTKADGSTDAVNLAAGAYTICETQASKGHGINTKCKHVDVRPGQTVDVVMDGEYAEPLLKAKVSITKVSAEQAWVENNGAQYSLAGATYVLKHGETIVHTFTTGADGRSDDKADVLAGDYSICETHASLGHTVNPKCRAITVKPSDDIMVTMDGEFTEPIVKSRITMKKFSKNPEWSAANAEQYPLAGATYVLKHGDTVVHTFTTGPDGAATDSAEVLAGTYTLVETRAPNGYKVNTKPRQITVAAGESKTVNMDGDWAEELIPAKVTMKKFSADPEWMKKYPGYYALDNAQYELRHDGKAVHTFTTRMDGTAMDSATVLAGEYSICEVKASLGHDINKQCKSVTLQPGDETVVNMDGEYAEPLKMREVGLKKASSKPVYSDANNAYDLSGAEYTLYDADNKPVHVFVTDRDGNVEPFKVRFGTYTLRETKAPASGYEMNIETKTAVITDGTGVYMF